MPSYQKYTPGCYEAAVRYIGSVASSSNSSIVIQRAPHKGTLLAAYYIPTASKDSAVTVERAIYIVNGGSAGTATTILASKAAATASFAAFVPQALTTQASCSWSASDVLEFQSASAAVGSDAIAYPGGIVQLDWRFER